MADRMAEGVALESSQHVRHMTRAEAQELQRWLVAEEWDEGEFDVDVLYDIDPEGFWALLDDEGGFAGGLSIVASTDSVATISHFYIRPEARGRGLAKRALPQVLELNASRIHDDVTITNFCWPHAVEDSARWGFAPLHEELRMVRPRDVASSSVVPGRVVDARTLDLRSIVEFDAARSGRRRETLWKRWLALPGARTVAVQGGAGAVLALGTIRPTAQGHRIGPLDASGPGAARDALAGLLAHAHGTRVAMDVPSANPDAVPLAREYGFAEDFRTVRTVWGVVPTLPWNERYATVMLHLD